MKTEAQRQPATIPDWYAGAARLLQELRTEREVQALKERRERLRLEDEATDRVQ